MKTYLNYLWCRFKEADKFSIFLCSGLASVFIGPILLMSTTFSIYNSYYYEPPSVWYIISNSPWAIVGLCITIFAMIFTLIMMLPFWDTCLYWTWSIIKSPYTISKWIYSSLQESNRRYKIWNGWKDTKVICFTCINENNCSMREDVYAEISGCSAYKVASVTNEAKKETS